MELGMELGMATGSHFAIVGLHVSTGTCMHLYVQSQVPTDISHSLRPYIAHVTQSVSTDVQILKRHCWVQSVYGSVVSPSMEVVYAPMLISLSACSAAWTDQWQNQRGLKFRI